MKGREQREKVEQGGRKREDRKGEQKRELGGVHFPTSCGKPCAVLLISLPRISNFLRRIAPAQKKVRVLIPERAESGHDVQRLLDVPPCFLAPPERSRLGGDNGSWFETASGASHDASACRRLRKQPANAARLRGKQIRTSPKFHKADE